MTDKHDTSSKNENMGRSIFDLRPIEQDEDIRITSNMAAGEIEQRIRRRIEKNRNVQVGFIAHLAIFIVANILIWGASLSLVEEIPLPAIVITGAWGVVLAVNAYQVYTNSAAARKRRQRFTKEEISREKQGKYL